MQAAAQGICGCGRDSAIAVEIYILWDGVLNYHFLVSLHQSNEMFMSE
jgi:hypothetical protein